MSLEDVPALLVEGGLRRYRATLAYDGTGLHGWARQPGLATVQELVEDALHTVLQERVAITCAGRTDAGVHADGQVVHFDASPLSDLVVTLRRLNAVLPPAVRMWTLDTAPPDFDARFAALFRRYRYLVCDDPRGPRPLDRQQILSVRYPLDLSAMSAAVALLVGEHDFGSFCRPKPGGTTIRTVRTATWTRDQHGLLALDIKADAFCHSMVRSIVGASIEIGRGKRDLAWLSRLLAEPSRVSPAPVAPPTGLVLVEVAYPPDADLSDQIALTKRRR